MIVETTEMLYALRLINHNAFRKTLNCKIHNATLSINILS